MEPEHLAWDDVEPAARAIFRVWTDQPELRWAQAAWNVLVAEGLTSYSSRLERTRVAIRFFTLGSLYLDWCAVAHEEPNDQGFEGWNDLLAVHPVYLGQLAGEDAEVKGDSDSEVVANAVALAMHLERPRVVAALREALGGDTGLFLSLWRSNEPARGSVETMFGWVQGYEDDEDGYVSETDGEIVNCITPLKVRAFEWITDSCPPS